MKKYLTILLLLPLLILSCGDDSQWEEDEDALANAKYEITNINYYMAQGDGIEIVTHKQPDTYFYNRGSQEQQFLHNNVYTLHETSLFIYQIGDADVQKKLDVDVKIETPQEGNEEEIYSLKKDWTFTDQLQSKGDKLNSGESTIRVVPQSGIKVSFSYEEKILTCSFKATLLNNITGEQKEITGKWKGSIFHHSSHTQWDEVPLPEK